MSTPRPLGACIRHGYGNSIHEKQDDCVNWFPVAEGVAAPLEPTPEKFEKANEEAWSLNRYDFAEAYAAAVSKNLQEELANEKLIKQEWRDLCKRNEENCFKALDRIRELEKEITALRETKP